MQSSLNVLMKLVDDLVNFDFNRRGVIQTLYTAATQKMSPQNAPLSLQIARRLSEILADGKVVVFLTGFPEMPSIGRGIPETDGPVGAALLARSLIHTHKVRPLVVTESHFSAAIRASLRGIGLSVIEHTTLLSARPGEPVSALLPINGQVDGNEFCERWKPAVIIAIERPGRNGQGEYHHMSGQRISHCLENIEDIFLTAKALGIPTVAIGDGGNEVGMGALEDVTRALIPAGDNCGCGCGGGIAATSEADMLMTACVANWGASAITAAMALVTNIRSALAPARLELRALEACAAAGAVDGSHNQCIPSVDGISASNYANTVSLIEWIVESYFEEN